MLREGGRVAVRSWMPAQLQVGRTGNCQRVCDCPVVTFYCPRLRFRSRRSPVQRCAVVCTCLSKSVTICQRSRSEVLYVVATVITKGGRIALQIARYMEQPVWCTRFAGTFANNRAGAAVSTGQARKCAAFPPVQRPAITPAQAHFMRWQPQCGCMRGIDDGQRAISTANASPRRLAQIPAKERQRAWADAGIAQPTRL